VKGVCVMGGAEVAQQALRAGQVNEMRIHLATLLLGAGTRLFEEAWAEPVALERTRVLEPPYATHLCFRVIK